MPNEKAIIRGFKNFVNQGYQGDINDYKELLNTNSSALEKTYEYFVSQGYEGSEEDLSDLFGLKKKDESQPIVEEEVMESVTEEGTEPPGSSDASSQKPKTSAADFVAPEPEFEYESAPPQYTETEEFKDYQKTQPEQGSIFTEDFGVYEKDSEEGKAIIKKRKEKAAEEKKIFDDLQKRIGFETLNMGVDEAVDYLNKNFSEEFGVTFSPDRTWTGMESQIKVEIPETGKSMSIPLQYAAPDVSLPGTPNYLKLTSSLNPMMFDEGEQQKYLDNLTNFLLKEKLTPDQKEAIQNMYIADDYILKFMGAYNKKPYLKQGQELYDAVENVLAKYPTLLGEDNEIFKYVSKNLERDLFKYKYEVKEFNEEEKALQDKVEEVSEKFNTGKMSPEDYQEQLVKLKTQYDIIEETRKQIKNQGLAFEKTDNILRKTKYEIAKNKFNREKDLGSGPGYLYNKALDALEAALMTKSISQTVIENLAGPQSNFFTEGLRQILLGSKSDDYYEGKPAEATEEEWADFKAKEFSKEIMPGIRGFFKENFGSGTTDAYEKAEDRNEMLLGLGSGIESFGAFKNLPASLVKGKNYKKLLSFLGLAAHSYGHLKEEMDNNPNFRNISLDEQNTYAGLYAMGIGALENLGWSFLMKGNPFSKQVLEREIMAVLDRLPKNATVGAMQRAITSQINNSFANGLFRIVDGMIVEGTTESLQQRYVDIEGKNLINRIKGKPLFNVPKPGSEEAEKQIAKATRLGTYAGGFFSGARVFVDYATQGFQESNIFDDIDFESETTEATSENTARVLQGLSDSQEFRQANTLQLQSDLAQGKITQAEAKTMSDAFNKTMGILNQIPANIQNIAKAYNLTLEKQNLEQSIKGKEPQLVIPEKNRIAEINKELTQLPTIKPTEDAISKQKTDAMVQGEQAGVVPTMVEGDTKPIVTPGKKETETEIEEVIQEPKSEETQIEEAALEDAANDLEYIINNPDFMLQADNISQGDKEAMIQSATKVLESVQPELEENASVIEDIKFTPIPVKFTENTELTDKVRKIKLSDIVGKKTNYVMADQLVTKGDMLGGPLFGLSDANFGKAAWASTREAEALKIIRGALDADFSTVYNMSPSAIDSNQVVFNKLAEKIETFDNSDEFFTAVTETAVGANKKALGKASEESTTVTEFINSKAFKDGLTLKQKAAIFTKILPSRNVDAGTKVKKLFQDKGVSMESVREEMSEQFTQDLPAGVLTTQFEVQDKQGNKLTRERLQDIIKNDKSYQPAIKKMRAQAKTKTQKNQLKRQIENYVLTQEAIITREQQKELGIPTHPNYPFYIRGTVTGLMGETAPMWNVSKESREVIDKKVDGLIEVAVPGKTDKKTGEVIPATTRPTTAKEALRADMRRAEMSSMKAKEISDPQRLNYETFLVRLNKAIPSIQIATAEELQELLDNVYAKGLSKKDQTIYGAVYNNKVYLNNDKANYNTPIHEFGHIWINVAETLYPEIYKRGIELIQEDNVYIDRIKKSEDYTRIIDKMREDGATEEEINKYIEKEALATAIGDKGEAFVKASIARRFLNWLNDLFAAIKKLIGISKVTPEQLADMTLDDFTQAVVVDLLSESQLFQEAEVNALSNELQLMTSSPNLTIEDIIQKGRDRGYSEEQITVLLKRKNFKAKEIKEALESTVDKVVLDDLFSKIILPKAFMRVEGGIKEATKLYNDTMQKLESFAIQGPRGGKGKAGVRTKTNFEIQEKAMELLKENPIFKKQYDQTQQELLVDFQSALKERMQTRYTAKSVREEIAAVKQNLKEQAKQKKTLQQKKIELRELIRKSLPTYKAKKIVKVKDIQPGDVVDSGGFRYKRLTEEEIQEGIKTRDPRFKEVFEVNIKEKVPFENLRDQSIKIFDVKTKQNIYPVTRKGSKIRELSTYTQKELDKLLKKVAEVDTKNFPAIVEEVLEEVEKKRQEIKTDIIKELKKQATTLSKTYKSRSGKRKGKKPIDAASREVFQAMVPILNDVLTNNVEALDELATEFADLNKIDEIVLKGEDMTIQEEKFLARYTAFNLLGQLNTQDLEQTERVYEEFKELEAEGRKQLIANISIRASEQQKIKDRVTNQIKKTNPALFDENGDIKNENEIRASLDEIARAWREKKYPEAVKLFMKSFKDTSVNDYMTTGIKNWFRHLGTLSNSLDVVVEGKSAFTDNLYRPLNRAFEVNIIGQENANTKLNDLAKEVGIEKGYTGVKMLLHRKTSGQKSVYQTFKVKTIPKKSKKGTTYKIDLTKDNMARLYALSLNTVQRNILEQQGIGKAEIEQMKKYIGPEVVEFVDKVVDFLSNEYYNEVNRVYSYINNINLTRIENYFPTRSLTSNITDLGEDFFKVFTAESSPFKVRSNVTEEIDLTGTDFIRALDNHILAVEKYKAYAVPVQNINSFIKIPAVNELLIQTRSKQLMNQLLNAAINPYSMSDSVLPAPFVTRLQRFFVNYVLGGRIIQIPKQASSFINAFEEFNYYPDRYKAPGVAKGVVDMVMFAQRMAKFYLVGLPTDLVGTIVPGVKGPVRKAYDLSATFRSRVRQGMSGEIFYLTSGRKTFKPAPQRMDRNAVIKRGFRTARGLFTTVGDILGVAPYIITYEQNLKNGMTEAEALELFNNYNATQQTRRDTEKTPLQLSNNPWVGFITMFGSTIYLQINKVMSGMKNIMDSIGNKKRPRQKDVRSAYTNGALANALFVALGGAGLLFGDNEDREKFWEEIGKALLFQSLLYRLPVVGSFAEEYDTHGRLIAMFKGEKYKPQWFKKGGAVNPINGAYYQVKRDFKRFSTPLAFVKTIADVILQMKIDPLIALWNMGIGEGTTEDSYDALGTPYSGRPEEGKRKFKDKKKVKKKSKKDKDSGDDEGMEFEEQEFIEEDISPEFDDVEFEEEEFIERE